MRRPIQRRVENYSSQAVTALRHMVLAGELMPGERLNEVGLAESLGISRAPVREAIQHLRNEGLLTAVSGRGAYVRSLTADELEELFEVRKLLEVQALRWAAERATRDELIRLREDVTERGHLLETYPSRPEETDFHLRLTRLARNTALLNLVTDVSRQTQLVRQRIADRNQSSPDRIMREHIKTLDAVIAGDVDQAASMLIEHLDTTLAEGIAILQRGERTD